MRRPAIASRAPNGLSAEMIVPPDFREMIRVRSAETGVVRTDDLDLTPETTGFVQRALHYYVPCVVRGRMVAVIGLGTLCRWRAAYHRKTLKFCAPFPVTSRSPSKTVCSIRNSRRRAGELKLLKEFNESIIESINVGLLAVDLDGRVTRLNSALEDILDLSRDAGSRQTS